MHSDEDKLRFSQRHQESLNGCSFIKGEHISKLKTKTLHPRQRMCSEEDKLCKIQDKDFLLKTASKTSEVFEWMLFYKGRAHL